LLFASNFNGIEQFHVATSPYFNIVRSWVERWSYFLNQNPINVER